MSIAKTIGRVIRGPYQDWGIEVAMRYLPVAQIARRAGFADDITELGSGSYGITPYLRRKITGVDTNFFEGENEMVDQIKGSVLDIPFEDASRNCVISVDMLEHIPSALREKAIDEMVRVSKHLAIMAFPYSKPSEDQDRELAEYYARQHAERYLFFDEHLELGLPKEDEVKSWVESALAKHKRQATVTYTPNSNLAVRKWLMKLWIRNNAFNKLVWILLNYLHPLFTRLNAAPCYRLIVTIQFND